MCGLYLCKPFLYYSCVHASRPARPGTLPNQCKHCLVSSCARYYTILGARRARMQLANYLVAQLRAHVHSSHVHSTCTV